MKGERVAQLELLLRSHPEGMRRAEIARRLGVHRSTISRYVEDLSEKIDIYEENNLIKIRVRDDEGPEALSVYESLAFNMSAELLASNIEIQNPHLASGLRKIAMNMRSYAPKVSANIFALADKIDEGLKNNMGQSMVFNMDYYLSRTDDKKTELAKSFSRRRRLLASPALQRQADRVYAEALARWKVPAYALPECEATEVLRRLTDKYKGKYLLIDFWGMSCAPCRMAIQNSKPMREALRDDKDVDFLFIHAEGEAPEKEYRKFVTAYLDGEDVQQISRSDYNKLMELFRFLGIPHYEPLDPDGNVVRDGLRYTDTPLFRSQVEELKQKRASANR